jgi:hypothetical protein
MVFFSFVGEQDITTDSLLVLAFRPVHIRGRTSMCLKTGYDEQDTTLRLKLQRLEEG